MNRLVAVSKKEDVFSQFRETPIGKLIEYHNLNKKHGNYEMAEILIGMCMDNRKKLEIPENFAFIIRTGGGNLRHSEFKVSFAIAIGQVSHIALIAHNNCGMVNLFSNKDKFINGLVEKAGWKKEWAEEHFMHFSPMFEIGNEVDFVLSETKRLRDRYPKIIIAPLMYLVEDNKLYMIEE